jgi:2-keto-4-pentenoate hydratase/2-oxohepta-3-ene-1,7-dioic acid hydratase in catechol pathway
MTTHPAPSFAIGTFSRNGDAPFAGLVVDDRVIDLQQELGAGITTLQLLDDWDASLERIGQIAAGAARAGQPLDELRPHVPVAARQILCAGANYHRHVRQMAYDFMRRDGDDRPEPELRRDAEQRTLQLAQTDPYVFAGLPSALSAANDDIVLWGPGVQHDWELELAVVIGRGGRDIPREQAMDHVAGYTICNDISTRDLLARPGFPMSDIVMTKNRPTFFPTGPFLVPRFAVADPSALRLTLRLNGEVVQDETTDDLIHPVDRLVAYASTAVELLPGDLLLTGSPAGNAAHHGNRWLRPGDVLEGEITGLGRQRNRCVAPGA